ncbi:MAG: nitroreductase family protein, partial [Spirochaetales bacterium]|nr:nitroreductase family protein [Spirochaetales bacterium]
SPFAVIFLADYQRTWDYFKTCDVEGYCREQGRSLRRPGEGDFLLACNDALIAAQTAVIAAESLGLGSCYIGDIMENYEYHRKLLKLPDYVFPVTMVCFGPPDGAHSRRRAVSRFEREFIHHTDSYSSLDSDDFDRMYAPWLRECGPEGGFRYGAANFGQHMYARKFDSEFSREMSRSVREALKLWES